MKRNIGATGIIVRGYLGPERFALFFLTGNTNVWISRWTRAVLFHQSRASVWQWMAQTCSEQLMDQNSDLWVQSINKSKTFTGSFELICRNYIFDPSLTLIASSHLSPCILGYVCLLSVFLLESVLPLSPAVTGDENIQYSQNLPSHSWREIVWTLCDMRNLTFSCPRMEGGGYRFGTDKL